jgi:hypothetical protein
MRIDYDGFGRGALGASNPSHQIRDIVIRLFSNHGTRRQQKGWVRARIQDLIFGMLHKIQKSEHLTLMIGTPINSNKCCPETESHTNSKS